MLDILYQSLPLILMLSSEFCCLCGQNNRYFYKLLSADLQKYTEVFLGKKNLGNGRNGKKAGGINKGVM